MSIFTSLLSLLGDNNLVPAIVPSITLIIATAWVFDPIIKVSNLIEHQSASDNLILLGLLVVFPVLILSYFLIAFNTYIFKLYSGYSFFNRFPFMHKPHRRRATRLMLRREELKRRILTLEKYVEKIEGRKRFSRRTKSEKLEKARLLLQTLKEHHYSVSAEYDSAFPPSLDEVMPTEFGNILRASEAYAGTRYGLDGVAFWPLLLAVIPPDYKKTIDSARNELAFIVNMSLLSIIFYFFCVLAILYSAPPPTSIDWIELLEKFMRYFFAASLALIVNIFLNRAAIYSVKSYGMMIRSAFGLFRLDLLDQFRLRQPKDSIEEFRVWKNLGELIVLGQESLDFKPLKYETKKQRKS